MGTWSIGLLCFKVFVVIEIESIAQAPETLPPFFFSFFQWFILKHLKRNKMHFTFWWEVVTVRFIQRGQQSCYFLCQRLILAWWQKEIPKTNKTKKTKKKITGWRATANSCAVQKNEWIGLHTLYMESNAPKNGVSEWYTSQIIFSIVWKYFVIKYCHKREIKHENNN